MSSEDLPVTSGTSGGLKLNLPELNPHFVCVLCFGYFVDATTITECMHTFCKSCIVSFLQKNHHCPHCDITLSRTRPFSSLKSDRVMQSLVYKTIPGLFQTEMRRRVHFYTNNPHPDYQTDVEEIQNYVFSTEDSVSLSIKYHSQSAIIGEGVWDTGGDSPERKKEADIVADFKAVRYFRCPATVPVSVLKALVKTKYRIPDPLRVELLYGDERLIDSWTLMEVAYIFQWKRESPMELSFQVFVTRKVKRKKLKLVKKVIDKPNSRIGSYEKNSFENGHEDVNSFEPPTKVPRLEESSYSSSSSVVENHPRPPTPPETPDGPFDALLESDHHNHLRSPSKHQPNASESSVKISSPKSPMVDDDDENHPSLAAEIESTIKQLEENSSYPIDDADSGDNAGDQDSEAPLEVDTSHETEPENDVDMEILEDKEDPKSTSIEEEQVDSAIDVTDMNETLDDSDGGKEIDQSFSSESFDDQGKINVDEEAATPMETDATLQEDEKDNDEEELVKAKSSSDTDLLGALDLSGHARTVRARKENSRSPESESEVDKVSKYTQNLQKLLAQANTSNSKLALSSIPKEMLQSLRFKLNNEPLTPGNLNAIAGGLPRPPFPLEWARPPLINTPVMPPQNTAAFNLMTLSHAVQFQLAMAQAQAQAQKMQAQVQANVLKNLKGTEILSFVNGSGDTLTISPITGSKGGQKTKFTPKSPKTVKSNHSTNQKVAKTNPVKKPVARSPSTTNGVGIKPTKKEFNFPKEFKFISKNKVEGMKNSINNNSSNKDNNNSKNLSGIKTTIPKSVLTSLKIPHVSLKSLKESKLEKDKKEQDKTKERTGDPVFKITNQKLIDFVRQQHLHKLKQNNKHSIQDESKVTTVSLTTQSNIQKLSTAISSSVTNNPNGSKVSNSLSTSKPITTPQILKSSTGFTQKSTIIPTNKLNSIHTKTLPNSSKISTAKTSINGSTLPVSKSLSVSVNSSAKVIPVSKSIPTSSRPSPSPSLLQTGTNGSSILSATSTVSNGVKINSTAGTKTNGTSTTTLVTKTSTSSVCLPKQQLTFTPVTTTSSTVTTNTSSALRTTNTSVRQIPNPSRLHHQSESRLTAGMNHINTTSGGLFAKKGIATPKSEGMSRLESLTRSLHEKASAGVGGSVLNSLAR